jgi:DNA-directed RNA polymerase subunit RPC12/RpoP
VKDDPKGALKDKWTGETLACPNCGEKALDKFTGGVDVKDGEITRTEFIYHCRNCEVNYTQEEYEAVK